MKWRSDATEQPGFDGFNRWSKPTPPKPKPVRADQKIGDWHTRPRTTRAPAVTFAISDWDRMWELKRRVAARVEAGEAYDAALAAVKRELWPEEYQG
jgi:hypothetical protein